MNYRICWSHEDGNGGTDQGCGPWSRNRRRIEKSVRFGNSGFGEGTHWVEHFNVFPAHAAISSTGA